MEIIIKGKRGEGKSYLAILIMKLLKHYPYKVTYLNQTVAQTRDKLQLYKEISKLGRNRVKHRLGLEMRNIIIYDKDDNEE